METRVCKYCEEEHPLEDFPIANIIKGKTYRRRKCIVCYRTSKRNRKNEIKEWFKNYKKTLKCKICNENTWYMLDFHHRDPLQKDVEVAYAIASGWSKERIMAEADKCDIYCSNHHRELHYLEKHKCGR